MNQVNQWSCHLFIPVGNILHWFSLFCPQLCGPGLAVPSHGSPGRRAPRSRACSRQPPSLSLLLLLASKSSAGLLVARECLFEQSSPYLVLSTPRLTFCQANYQWPGQYPGGAPGGFPGAPGGFPGAPGGFPGQGGGFPGAQPGWPQAPQQPQQPQWPPPVPTHPPQPAQPVQTPQPVQPVQPVPTSPPVAPVVAETTTKAPVTNRPAGSSPGQCGVGRYHPIRYDSNGQVAEEVERANEAGAKIVNGWDADQGEWPWIAALMNNGRQFCGGSLITRKHILTAAHCVAHMSRYDVANLKVRLGEHAIKQTGETQLFESKAARVVRHKEFSQQTLHKVRASQYHGRKEFIGPSGRCCDHPGDGGARSAKRETRVPRRIQRSRPGSADCHRGWMGKSQGERAAAKHPAGGDRAHLGQQGVQGHVRTRRPWRHHGPHALCWTEGEGLLQCKHLKQNIIQCSTRL